jgi:hypothetical protein
VDGAASRLIRGPRAGSASWPCALRLGVAVLALACTGASRADALAVQGGCRDGLPQGAWQLAAPDGTLRAIGAFSKGRRTGSFIYWNAAGVRIAHVPYDEGARDGTLAAWYDEPRRDGTGIQRLEAHYVDGALAGVKRSWHRDGRLRGEYTYVAGELVEAKAWDARGRELSPAEALARAAADAAADEAFHAKLDALVNAHLPHCDPGSSPKPR